MTTSVTPPTQSRPTEPPPEPKQRRRRAARKRETLNHHRLLPYAFIGPAVVFELLVHVGPMLLGIWISLTKLTQLTIRQWTSAPFVGLQNFRNGLNPDGPIGSALFESIVRTAIFTVVVVACAWAIGLLAAVLLTQKFRGRAVVRTFFLVPFALPAFVTTIGWSFMFNKNDGAINHVIVDQLHLTDGRPFWLLGNNSFVVLIVVAIWRMWPFAFLMLLAALQNVPGDVYEAASLDGASTWRQFRSVTLPMIKSANSVVVLVMALWTFNEFNIPFVLFGPQPPTQATLLSNLIYSNSFVNFNFGLGAAMSVLLLVILMVVSIFYIKLVMPKEDKNA